MKEELYKLLKRN